MMIVIWLLTGIIFTGIAYAIHNKKQYSLISGYSNYTDEEKLELEKNGYVSYIGRFLWGFAII